MILKIGIDLDGVVFDSEKLFRVYAELYDILELHQNGIIDNREVKFQDRYNWTKDIKNEEKRQKSCKRLTIHKKYAIINMLFNRIARGV